MRHIQRLTCFTCGIATGLILNAWYQQSPRAHRWVFWLFNVDTRRQP